MLNAHEKPAFGREAMREFFVVWLAKAQRRKEKPLGGLAALREFILFFSHRRGACLQ